MTGTYLDALWQKDASGMCHPERLVGKTFVHVKTAKLYRVNGFALNTMTGNWSVAYDRYFETDRKEFHFVRDMHEFLDGRFAEVT